MEVERGRLPPPLGTASTTSGSPPPPLLLCLTPGKALERTGGSEHLGVKAVLCGRSSASRGVCKAAPRCVRGAQLTRMGALELGRRRRETGRKNFRIF